MARRFAAEGAAVVIADVDRDAGAALAEDIGSNAVFAEADVSQLDQIGALVATAVERFGGLHVMVNNAGVSSTMHRSIFEDDFADYEKVMAVNLRGVMAGTRDAARHMREGGTRGALHQPTPNGGGPPGGGGVDPPAAERG